MIAKNNMNDRERRTSLGYVGKAKSRLRQGVILTGLALAVFGAGGLNIKGCNNALENKENPYGLASRTGYNLGEEIRDRKSQIPGLGRLEEKSDSIDMNYGE